MLGAEQTTYILPRDDASTASARPQRAQRPNERGRVDAPGAIG